jgi:hypothetical protein
MAYKIEDRLINFSSRLPSTLNLKRWIQDSLLVLGFYHVNVPSHLAWKKTQKEKEKENNICRRFYKEWLSHEYFQRKHFIIITNARSGQYDQMDGKKGLYI